MIIGWLCGLASLVNSFTGGYLMHAREWTAGTVCLAFSVYLAILTVFWFNIDRRDQ